MNGDSERIQKEAVAVTSNIIPVASWEGLKKPMPAEIRTEHLSNTNLEPNTDSNPPLQSEANDNLNQDVQYFIPCKYIIACIT
jgi:hypothetical protein